MGGGGRDGRGGPGRGNSLRSFLERTMSKVTLDDIIPEIESVFGKVGVRLKKDGFIPTKYEEGKEKVYDVKRGRKTRKAKTKKFRATLKRDGMRLEISWCINSNHIVNDINGYNGTAQFFVRQKTGGYKSMAVLIGKNGKCSYGWKTGHPIKSAFIEALDTEVHDIDPSCRRRRPKDAEQRKFRSTNIKKHPVLVRIFKGKYKTYYIDNNGKVAVSELPVKIDNNIEYTHSYADINASVVGLIAIKGNKVTQDVSNPSNDGVHFIVEHRLGTERNRVVYVNDNADYYYEGHYHHYYDNKAEKYAHKYTLPKSSKKAPLDQNDQGIIRLVVQVFIDEFAEDA